MATHVAQELVRYDVLQYLLPYMLPTNAAMLKVYQLLFHVSTFSSQIALSMLETSSFLESIVSVLLTDKQMGEANIAIKCTALLLLTNIASHGQAVASKYVIVQLLLTQQD